MQNIQNNIDKLNFADVVNTQNLNNANTNANVNQNNAAVNFANLIQNAVNGNNVSLNTLTNAENSSNLQNTNLNTNANLVNNLTANNATATNNINAKNLAINTPVSANNWNTQLGDKIVWMAKNNIQSAEISITPDELGPIKISLQLAGDKANITFMSAHSEIRQLIQNSLPELKEMLASSGFNLGQTNVGDNAQNQQWQQQNQHAFWAENFANSNGNNNNNDNNQNQQQQHNFSQNINNDNNAAIEVISRGEIDLSNPNNLNGIINRFA